MHVFGPIINIGRNCQNACNPFRDAINGMINLYFKIESINKYFYYGERLFKSWDLI